MARDPRALLQQAEELRKSGRLSDAIDACLKALDAQPGLDALRVTLGRTYLESGQADLAKQTLSEVFGRLPEHHLAGKLLAEAQKEIGERGAAEETCLKLLETYPRDREIEAILKSVREADPNAQAPAPAASSPAASSPAAPSRVAPAPAPAPLRRVAPPEPPRAAAEAHAPTVAAGEPVEDPMPDYVPEDVAGSAPETTPPRAAAPMTAAAPPPAAPMTAAAPAAAPAAEPPRAAAAPTVRAPETAAPSAPATAAPAPAPAPAPTPAPASRASAPSPSSKSSAGDALQTNTLAELYVKQGLVDRAIEVYRGMLKLDPANDRARRRLEELQSAPAPQAPAATAPAAATSPVVPPASAAPPAPAIRTPAAFSDPAVAARAAAIRRLEEWLGLMQRGRDAGGRMER